MNFFRCITAFVIFFGFAPLITSGASGDWYSDVPEHSLHYDGIAFLTQAGFVEGYEDGSFQPDKVVSRVEALKMILSASIIPLEWEKIASYPDTVADEWYAPYLNTAATLDIASGHADGNFKPEDPVNRIEALKMLTQANNATLPDIANDYWYSAYLAYGQEHALIVPNEDGDYEPAAALTRGELADLIYRFQSNPYTDHVEYGIASYYGSSFDGHNTASGTALDTDGFMAAHKTLPFGTVLRVTNLNNGKVVEATVVDRGPYTQGYIVDLTPTAFEQIGALSTGILRVRLEVLK